MPLIFNYLWHRDNAEHKGAVFEDVVKSPNDLAGRVLMRDSAANKYVLFDTIDDVIARLADAAAKPQLHEVLLAGIPQRLKFDIDAKWSDVTAKFPAEIDQIRARVIAAKQVQNIFGDTPIEETANDAEVWSLFTESYIAEFVKYVIDLAFSIWGIEITPHIYTSHRNTGELKASYHVICDAVVASCYDAAAFTTRLIEQIPPFYAKFVDTGVNSANHCFRAVGAFSADGRRLGGNPTTDEIRNSFILQFGATPLPSISDEKAKQSISDTLTRNMLAAIEYLGAGAPKYWQNHANWRRLTDAKKHSESMFAQRIGATHCQLCARVHDADNTVIVSLHFALDESDSPRCYLYEHCRKSKGSIGRGSFVPPEPPTGLLKRGANWSETRLGDAIEWATGTKPAPAYAAANLPVSVSGQITSNYCADAVRALELVSNLIVVSPMKTGKTRAVIDFIDKYFGTATGARIISVSFRQTFSADIKAKFPGFTLYSDVKGELTQSRLIVQTESLWRIPFNGVAPDLLIIDESESVLEQFQSNLYEKFQRCWQQFLFLVKHSKHVVWMDALAGERTQYAANLLRKDVPCIHLNTFRNGSLDKYHVTSQVEKWSNAVFNAINAGKRIAIATSSLKEAETTHRLIEKKFPDKKIKLYSSKTDAGEKRLHFADVNKWWCEYDIIVYTPTISAGVSFEQAHFDVVAAMFTSVSCAVETCIQMLGRVRNVASHEYLICLQDVPVDPMPITKDGIIADLRSAREELFKQYDDSYLDFKYDTNGVTFVENEYFGLWTANRIMCAKSRNAFSLRFLHYVIANGSTCDIIPDITPEITLALRADRKTAKGELDSERIASIVGAAEIDNEVAAAIQEKFANAEIVDIAQRNSYERWKIRHNYEFEGEITTDFVAKFSDAATTQIYRNLRQICSISAGDAPVIEDSIRILQRIEVSALQFNTSMGNDDPNTKYKFVDHRVALALLRLCGFQSPIISAFVGFNELLGRLRMKETEALAAIDLAKKSLDIRVLTDRLRWFGAAELVRNAETIKWVKDWVKSINLVISVVYGCTIAETGDGMHKLTACELFKINTDGDGKLSVAPVIK